MSRFQGWRARLRSLVRGGQADARMEEEFRFHLEMEVEKNLRAGMAAEAARRRALVSFGGIDQQRESMREGRGVRWLDDLVRDARVGVRGLRRSPGFTVTTLLTVACGVGATTAVFSAVDAALLRPLPFESPDRLVTVDVGIPFGGSVYPDNPPDIIDVRDQSDVFAGVAAYAPGGVNLSGVGAPRRIRVGVVTPDLFATLGVAPVLGRGFTSEEGERGGPAVAVLSYGLWASAFGADPDVTGRVVTLNGKAYTSAGVMPRGFGFPEEAEVWVPLTVPATFESFEYFRQYMPSRVVARLASRVSVEQAEARLAGVWARSSEDEDPAAGATDRVSPLRRSLVGDRQAALFVLLGATALVLLVACANVAHLLLARAVDRRREIALRTILGASSTRVLRQILTENMLLAVAGGLLGVAVAFAIGRVLDVLIPA
ncbi:MAG: ABC transporter permease, partial [Longimicrobiales bacterium]